MGKIAEDAEPQYAAGKWYHDGDTVFLLEPQPHATEERLRNRYTVTVGGPGSSAAENVVLAERIATLLEATKQTSDAKLIAEFLTTISFDNVAKLMQACRGLKPEAIPELLAAAKDALRTITELELELSSYRPGTYTGGYRLARAIVGVQLDPVAGELP